MILRDYQERAIAAVRERYRSGRKRVLLVMATGGGKTATASALLAASVARGKRCVFVVHRREIVLDTARRLREQGLRVGVVMAGEPFDAEALVHVCSIQTVAEAEPGKNYRERVIPVAPEVLEFAKRFLAWRSGKGQKGKRVGCAESWLVKLLHRAQKQARVPLFGLHDLRAAFATEAFDRGVGLVVIQGWLGHADPATTQGYIRPRRSDVQVVAPIPPGLVLSATSPTAESLPKVSAVCRKRTRKQTGICSALEDRGGCPGRARVGVAE